MQERDCPEGHEANTGAAPAAIKNAGSREFYVYRLVDPRDHSCFYIGKGKGDRAWTHQKTATCGSTPNHRKRSRILEILTAGLEVRVEIVARFAEERLAYAHEYDLIQTTANLTNIAPGWAPPPTLAQIQEARRQVRLARRLARIKQAVNGRKSQYERFVGGLPDRMQDVAAEWLKSLEATPTDVINLHGDEQKLVIVKSRHRHTAQPIDKPKKRRNTRKLRRKYRKSTDRLDEAKYGDLPPIPKLPPALS